MEQGFQEGKAFIEINFLGERQLVKTIFPKCKIGRGY